MDDDVGDVQSYLINMDSQLNSYTIEFFIDIDNINGIIHIKKMNNPTTYSAMFTYIVFRKFYYIETNDCSSMNTFMIELDRMLNMTFTNKFQSRLQNDVFIAWRRYVHHIQNIPVQGKICYICLEDSFDSKLPCGHFLCMKCQQKAEKKSGHTVSSIKCGICRKKTIRRVTHCINTQCRHFRCRFSEEVIPT